MHRNLLATNGDLSAVREVAFPNARGAVSQISLVTRSREIQSAIGSYCIDGLRGNSVLEGRFIKVRDVIDNDIAAGRAKVKDVLRKACFTDIRGSEIELRSWGKIVDDFEHCRPFATTRKIAAGVDPALSGKDGNRAKLTSGLRPAQIVHAVG